MAPTNKIAIILNFSRNQKRMGPLTTGEVIVVGAIVVIVGWVIIGLVKKLFSR